MIIPAISLWQPWASLIAAGVKPDETRAKRPPAKLIGKRIAIHAAKRRVDRNMPIEFCRAVTEDLGSGWAFNLPLGAVICTALLVDVRSTNDVDPNIYGNFAPGRYSYLLDEVLVLEKPIPAVGRQSLGWPWEAPEGVE